MVKKRNLWVIPTDKPSRLRITSKGKLILSTIAVGSKGETQNIYITNDEEIKEGDWFHLDMSHSDTLPDEIHQMGNDNWSKTGGIHFCEGNSWVKSCKKIILTTDQDLIKDGVQAIDDEFLQWFVKNPNCEEVEVEDINNKWHKEDGSIVSVSVYKIIIPKVEHKGKALSEQEVMDNRSSAYDFIDVDKQETTLEDKLKSLVEQWQKRQEEYVDIAYKNVDNAHANRKFTYKAMATRDCWKELITLLNKHKDE